MKFTPFKGPKELQFLGVIFYSKNDFIEVYTSKGEGISAFGCFNLLQKTVFLKFTPSKESRDITLLDVLVDSKKRVS